MTQSEIALNWTCPILRQTGRKSGLFNMFIWTCPIAGVALFVDIRLATPTKKIWTKFSKFSKKYFYIFLATPTKIFWTKFSKFPKKYFYIFLATPPKFFWTKFSKFPKKYFYIYFGHAPNFFKQISRISQKVFLHIRFRRVLWPWKWRSGSRLRSVDSEWSGRPLHSEFQRSDLVITQ